jgi:hypothetical protein
MPGPPPATGYSGDVYQVGIVTGPHYTYHNVVNDCPPTQSSTWARTAGAILIGAVAL